MQPVSAVPTVDKAARRRRDVSYYHPKYSAPEKEFSQVLQEVSEEKFPDAPMHCHTVTYGRDRRLRTFLYHSGEYRY